MAAVDVGATDDGDGGPGPMTVSHGPDRGGERPRVLVTGFEPFGGQEVNASWLAVTALASGWDGPAELLTACLPVSFRRARQDLRVAVREHRPDVVVLVGEAPGRSVVSLERVALNLIDARVPDADGSAPVDVPVVAGAPTAFLTRLPVKAAWAAVHEAGVPVEVSGSAGTYVCNATFYALMHLLDALPDVRGGFVHVPRTPAQVADGAPALPVAESARALRVVVETAVGTDRDVRLAAGTLA